MISVEEHGEVTKVFQIVEWTKTSVQRPTEPGWYRIDLGGWTTKARLTRTSNIVIDMEVYDYNFVWADGTPLTPAELRKLLEEKDAIFYFPKRLKFSKFEYDKDVWIIYENKHEPLYWVMEDNDGETKVGPSYLLENDHLPIHKLD